MASVSGTYNPGDSDLADAALRRRYATPRLFNRTLIVSLTLLDGIGGHSIWLKLPWHWWYKIPGIETCMADSLACRIAWRVFWFISDANVGAMLFAIIGFLGALFVIFWISRFRGRRRHRGYAATYPMPWMMSLAPEAFVTEAGDIQSRVKWSCIKELALCADSWAFFIYWRTDIVPRKAFADSEAERAFIREALGYMTEEARARSKDAVKFAASKAA